MYALKKFFVPSEKNHHTPYLLGRYALIIYIIVILLFNFVATQLNFANVTASFEIQALLQEHNNERLKRGLESVQINPLLSSSAYQKGIAMLNSNCWSHYCPDGKDWRDYFVEGGYDYLHAGENLAEGFSTVSGVMSAWMNSETHRANILNREFKEIGFAVITGNYQGKENNTIIVVHFGTPMPTSSSNPASDIIVPSNISVTIDYPLNGQSFSNGNVEIKGRVEPSYSEVTIEDNYKEIGRINADGDNYSFRPDEPLREGAHQIVSKVINKSGQVQAASESVSFEIDNSSPFIIKSTTKVEHEGSYYVFKFNTSESVDSIITDIPSFDITRYSPTNWGFKVLVSDLENNRGIAISLTDKAGNLFAAFFDMNDIRDFRSQAELPSQSINSLSSNFIAEFFKELAGSSIKAKFLFGFIVYMVILLIIDFIFLQKSQMLQIRTSKSHFHISIFVILLLFLLIGGATGSILTGTNL